MADKTIGSLPQAPVLTDDSSFVCEDSGVAKRVTGKQFKDFAREGAAPAVKAAESAAERAEAATLNAPKIQNGTWWTFDQAAQEYVDTGVEAQGPRGIRGEKGETGEPGKDGYTPVKGVDYFDGEPGEKGDPFTYDDFTPEQLDDLERGAKAAQAAAETAAASAENSAQIAEARATIASSSAMGAEESATNAANSAASAQIQAMEAKENARKAAESAARAAELIGQDFATKTEVAEAIQAAIGDALGGSY